MAWLRKIVNVWGQKLPNGGILFIFLSIASCRWLLWIWKAWWWGQDLDLQLRFLHLHCCILKDSGFGSCLGNWSSRLNMLGKARPLPYMLASSSYKLPKITPIILILLIASQCWFLHLSVDVLIPYLPCRVVFQTFTKGGLRGIKICFQVTSSMHMCWAWICEDGLYNIAVKGMVYCTEFFSSLVKRYNFLFTSLQVAQFLLGIAERPKAGGYPTK